MEPEEARKQKAGDRGSLIRRLGPAIPLGIALLHGVLTPQQAGGPVQPGSPVPQGSETMGARKRPAPPVPAGGLACVADGNCKPPFPLASKGHPVDWFFVFKLNAAKFPKCGAGVDGRTCPFDNGPKGPYSNFGQRYVLATADAPTLVDGTMDCLGTTEDDPVGATFGQVYNGNFHYALWNDQFQGPPMACGQDECKPPWAHSKGMVAWNDDGEGFVMQVTTPGWPGSGSAKFPRVGNGNTLGCMTKNDVEWSQHFFALRLTEPDLLQVLHGLASAMVVSGALGGGEQILNNGGPEEIQVAAKALGNASPQKAVSVVSLSSGIRLITKPHLLQVPPWQMVSSVLGGVSLRTANWSLASPGVVYSTTKTTPIGCWDSTDPGLKIKAGAVEIAATGSWNKVPFSLVSGNGGGSPDGNHAKVGISTTGTAHYAIFGDMNQQGSLTGNCGSAQNGRGGLFFVMDNKEMWTSLGGLIAGESVPTGPATAP